MKTRLLNPTNYFFNSKSYHLFGKRNKYFLVYNDTVTVFEISKTSFNILKSNPPITLEKISREPRFNNNILELKKSFEELIKWKVLKKENEIQETNTKDVT